MSMKIWKVTRRFSSERNAFELIGPVASSKFYRLSVRPLSVDLPIASIAVQG